METRIPYKPKSLFLLGSILCFGLMFCATGYMAITETAGVNLFNLISLNHSQATILYSVLSGISAVCMVTALVFLYLTLTQKREIVFTENGLQFPHKGFTRHHIHVPYHDIVQTREVQVNRTNIFNVDFRKGELSLYSSMVPGRSDYELFKSEITHRVYKQ